MIAGFKDVYDCFTSSSFGIGLPVDAMVQK
jgi:hypothetical protein